MEKFKGMLLFASVSKETVVAGERVCWDASVLAREPIYLILRDVYNNPQN
jgi:hypothetical protein